MALLGSLPDQVEYDFGIGKLYRDGVIVEVGLRRQATTLLNLFLMIGEESHKRFMKLNRSPLKLIELKARIPSAKQKKKSYLNQFLS